MQHRHAKKDILVVAAAGIAVMSLAACGVDDSASDEFIRAAPELSTVQLALTDDVTAEGLATDELSGAVGAISAGLDNSSAPYLGSVRQGIRELNQQLRAGLEPITAMLRDQAPSVLPGDVRVWGPVTRGATDYRFVMRRGALIRGRFSWALFGKPSGAATDLYVTVAAGDVVVGDEPHLGAGLLGVNLDNFGDVDPTVHARGKLMVRFAHGPNGTALAYRFQNFTADAEDASRPPFSAILDGVHLAADNAADVPARNYARLAYYGDVPDSTSAESKELVLARARHARGIGGRVDAIITQGDVGQGKALFASECWSVAAEQLFLIVRECNAGSSDSDPSCTVQRTDGDPTACPQLFIEAIYPPADPTASDVPPEVPADLELAPPAADEFPTGPEL